MERVLVVLRTLKFSDFDGLRSFETGTGNIVRPTGVVGRAKKLLRSSRGAVRVGRGEAGMRARLGAAERGIGIELGPSKLPFTDEASGLREDPLDGGRRIDIPKMVVGLIPKFGVVRPDSETLVRDTTRVEPVVDAGVIRPDAGISLWDSGTLRKAEGGGLSCADRRE